MDIRIAAVPSEDVSGAVNQRTATAEKPTVRSIGPSEARLDLAGFSLRYEYSPLAQHSLDIIGMHHIRPARSNSLFERHSRVIHPAAVHKIDDALRSLRPELSRDGVDDQPSPVFRLPRGCYVHQGSHKFDVARSVHYRVTYDSYPFDGIVLHQQSMFKIKILLFLRDVLDGPFHKGGILR